MLMNQEHAQGASKQTVRLTPEHDREIYLNEVMEALARTGRVYAHNETILLESEGRLNPINNGGQMAQVAGRLVNIVKVNHTGTARTITRRGRRSRTPRHRRTAPGP